MAPKANDSSVLCQSLINLEAQLKSNAAQSDSNHQFIIEKCNEMASKFAALQSTFDSVVEENKILKREITELKKFVNYSRQQSQASNMIISGVVECEASHHELINVSTNCIRKVDPSFQANEIIHATRIGNIQPEKSRPILVKFARSHRRDEILHRKRKYVFADDSTNHSKGGCMIFFDEHLTKENRDIFAKARTLKRNGVLKFTWVRRGRILVRVREGDSVVHIKSIEDLDILAGNPSSHTNDLATDNEGTITSTSFGGHQRQHRIRAPKKSRNRFNRVGNRRK